MAGHSREISAARKSRVQVADAGTLIEAAPRRGGAACYLSRAGVRSRPQKDHYALYIYYQAYYRPTVLLRFLREAVNSRCYYPCLRNR